MVGRTDNVISGQIVDDMNLKYASFGFLRKWPAQERCEMILGDYVRKTYFQHYQMMGMWYLKIGDDTCQKNFVLCFGLFIWHIYRYLCIYGAAHCRTTCPQIWRCSPLHISSINFQTPK